MPERVSHQSPPDREGIEGNEGNAPEVDGEVRDGIAVPARDIPVKPIEAKEVNPRVVVSNDLFIVIYIVVYELLGFFLLLSFGCFL